MFAGRLGNRELAGATLADSWASITGFTLMGAPLAASISLWISVFVLAIYVIYAKKFEHTWGGFSFESFRYIHIPLKLALPSAAMVCLEDWASEILVLLAGLMPDSEITTSLLAMCVNIESIASMFAYGLSAAASTRISNELGAGNPDRAKNAIAVTLKLSVILAFVVVLALAFGGKIWTNLFSDSPIITKEFASMLLLLAISIIIDSVQGVLSGVARGCGWQHLAVWANLATFYFIGMPLACLLGFKLQLYAKGLWIGLVCGLSCQACTFLLITLRTKLTKTELLMGTDEEILVVV
ncbi:hypothetical protein GH714_014028 [Hevea brasiliensis]|uniref:Protein DETOXIFICATION n=1 Tax=Hevea brasiliensis TaxID=3981 RepID=A0A6A6KBT5_HEVBR|nr:hypothetical protein GH714_014028 [Hevea brasiliensis]